MNRMTDRQRTICAAALSSEYPLAVWRAPYGSNFTLSVSTSDVQMQPVFDGNDVPGFVMAPFDGDDGNLAYLFPADIVLAGDQTWFRDGQRFALAPIRGDQADIVRPRHANRAQAPACDRVPVGTPDQAEYEALVGQVVDMIKSGRCEKIVLSRIERRLLDADYDLCTIVEALAAAHPHAFVALASSGPTGTWLVATPEILLRESPSGVETMALAGTQWPDPGTDISTLSWSDKIIIEQALVVDYIRGAFEAEGLEITSQTEPRTVRAANLCHLRSDFRAKPAGQQQLANLLRRMHPTSAVCGTPKEEARDVIHALEGTGRGFYTGYLGYRGIGAETALYVNLRSARVAGREIFLYVGGGIVEQSDPAVEWNETVAKTKTIMTAL